ncbi:MAG TPA: hypothetical protein VMF61_09250 [Candidatus Acidoferrales bacterium]|nr:hypothetical protein [Candidatus Acidoferrales bacterium]
MLKLKSILVAALIAGSAILTTTAANAASLHVKNLTNKTIALLYVSPSDESRVYPEDQRLNNSQYIRPGETWNIAFNGRDECDFDLFAVFTDHTVVKHYDANLCGDDGSPMLWTLY